MNNWFEPAVETLIAARKGAPRPVRLPPGSEPASLADAYLGQDALVRRLGGVAGWKVGAQSPTAEPFRAALTADTLHASPARRAARDHNVIGVEAEIAYILSEPLPMRAVPYTRAEVLAAIGSVHAAIEIVDTRFAAWGIADRPSQLVDQFNHGALIVGEGRTHGFEVDPDRQSVQLDLNGCEAVRQAGGNSAGDAIRLVLWLANGGAAGQGGLAAGTRITTGSWTGTLFVGPGTQVRVHFEGIGSVQLDIA